MHQDFAVRAGLENGARFPVHPAQAPRVGQVAVMGDGPWPVAAFHDQRLDVLHPGGPGCGITHVPDPHVPGQLAPGPGRKHVADQPHPLDSVQKPAIACDNPSAFLPAVLQRKQALVDQGRGILRAKDAKNTARLPRTFPRIMKLHGSSPLRRIFSRRLKSPFV